MRKLWIFLGALPSCAFTYSVNFCCSAFALALFIPLERIELMLRGERVVRLTEAEKEDLRKKKPEDLMDLFP